MNSRGTILEKLHIIQGQLTSLQEQVNELIEEVDRSTEFELVGGTSPSPAPSSSIAAPGPKARASIPAYPKSQGAGGVSVALRERAAIETGHYFVRCLTGQRRGPSGRELLNLAPNIYVIIQEFNGTQHTFPILRYIRYSCVLKFVENPDRRGDFGDSIFAGFFEEWEARLAVSTAGFVWPDATD